MSKNHRLTLSIPSKGRLMEDTLGIFREAGINIVKDGDERGYRGKVEGDDSIEVLFSSASEIAYQLKSGRVHLGVTGEDLIRETIYDAEKHVKFLHELQFGHADVVVAVPHCWLDVEEMKDLEEVAVQFHTAHARRLRVATKYMMITRRFFTTKGIIGYRIVESTGATEGAPSSGAAELIVDITSTGATLVANHLKILKDGVILKSQANLISSRKASWTNGEMEIRDQIAQKIEKVLADRASA